MNRFGIISSLLFICGIYMGHTQVSPDCANAIPICNNTPVNGGTDGFGVDDFGGAQTSGCLEQTITNAIESNSAWYRFRTGAAGQLGFNISTNTSEDWDFALYRAADCNSLGEPVRCNFFDNQDQNSFLGVGEDPTGDTSNIQYEDWLQVEPGEDYYLLLNNFSNSNSGFSIQFSGQIFVTDPYTALDCSIISNLLGPPISACEGTSVVLDATTADADSYSWFQDTGSGFQGISGETGDTLSVTTSGLYRVQIVTLTNDIISGNVQVGFSAVPTTFSMNDEASCSGSATFDLALKDSEALGNQDPNGFVVSYHSTLADATAGVNFLPKAYPAPSGTQTIYVRVTSTENPNCFDASQQFQLINLETPILDFPSEVFLCDGNPSIAIGEPIAMTNHTYSWGTGETTSSINVSQAGTYTVTVTNTQAGLSCSNSKSVTMVISTPPAISNIEIEDLQNDNTVNVLTDVDGNWEYQIDGGAYQSESLFRNVTPGVHTITVNDPRGCGSDSEEIVVVGFPKFFTPNGDAMHDRWHIEGIAALDNPVVTIYDRFGKLLKQMTSTTPGWDGTFNGKLLPSADYWFKLTYSDTNGQVTTAKYINNHFSLRR